MDTALATADLVQKFLTPLSLLVTAWLGYLVYRSTTDAPVNAAKLAADLTAENAKNSEQERRRMYVFATLMAARRSVYSAETIGAFNLIDVVFHNCRAVREAWADLYAAYADLRHNNPSGYALKLRALLFQMAKVLEIGADIRVEDVNRVYVSESSAQRAAIEMAESERRFRQLQSPASANAAAPEPAVAPQIPPAVAD